MWLIEIGEVYVKKRTTGGEKALYYKHRYELAEFEAIRTLLLDTWCAIEPDQLGLNILSDDYCFLCIVKEDLSCLNV